MSDWKRPKPVVPWLYSVTAVLNMAVAVLYFTQERWGYAALWAVIAVVWGALVPFTWKTHRINVKTWETFQRLRRAWDS